MPRLFIAIRFSDQFKQKLVAIQNALRERGVQGNYCPLDNLHITLVFIGEQYELSAVREAVKKVNITPFELSLGGLGSFPTKAGVIWCGIKDSRPIAELTDRLKESLSDHGVTYKDMPFYPHISLVQHPSAIVTDIDVPEAAMEIKQINIMKSERINDKLVYSEIW